MADDRAALEAKVRALSWFHQIELPHGVVTPGVAENRAQLPRIGLPERLDGKDVLDVGTWDGFYAFECARRGATRVLATDQVMWDSPRFSQDRGFRLAREALGLTDVVHDQRIDVGEIAPETVGGPFDVVLFLGVLYHVLDPVTAVERVSSVCRDLLIVETETALNWLPYPAARLYPGTELAGDDTNWYSLNIRAIRGLLERQGFEHIEVRWRTRLPQRLAWAAGSARRTGSFRRQLRSERVVIHARRSVR